MAQKRMFDKRVVESDRFMDLPNSSKALYFMAGMSADDRGFFQPKRLQKMCGFTDDDYKILIAKQYFIPFESGVMVITDWTKNNWLDSRRITETEYIDELNLLKKINDKYELNCECLANAKPMLSQNRIEENSIEENRIVESSIEAPATTIFEYYENVIGSLSRSQYERLNNYSKTLTDEMIIYAIDKTKDAGANSFNYLEAILKAWKQKEYKCIGDVLNEPKKGVKTTPEWFEKEIHSETMTREEQDEIQALIESVKE